ncbi:hypothetical protein FHS18_003801 [Paenibacillus phyllosphaerae]|uniref:Alpha/beta hydrolase fold-5 domain-containing protein n=1 Tax=Paenibacillus phyllosphaerae TaxID=274593 RepID=A0A7W5FP02_9BACL|nr:alpha/beta hydrolase [Paenibacillus phyllosphaerae]MBB3111733.1 hypothetical protein [Paenibacillus phyllosphaerae]
MHADANRPTRKSRWKKVLLWGGAIVLIIVIAGFVYLNSITYQPSATAEAAFQTDGQVKVTNITDGYQFEPADGQKIKQPNIIFYPGGLVEPESYSPLARELAEAGHRVFVADMPLNLAMFGQNKAGSFISDHSDESFVIGGHSLGGVFAARYAAAHTDQIQGVFFLASYADDGGAIRDTDLSALQITGTNDAVLNTEAWESSKTNLPEDTVYVQIDGGNHGQFGSYGMQKGDQEPTVSEQEQTETTAAAIEDWVAKLIP